MNACIFGDSIGKGIVYDDVTGKYIVHKAGFPESIRNFSSFGCTSERGIKIMQRHDSALSSFERVFIEYGGNDSDFDWKSISQNPEISHDPKVSVETFKNNLIRLVERVKLAGSEPVLMNLPPIDPERYFSWISRGLSAENILRWLGNKKRIFDFHEMYSAAVAEAAASSGCLMADIRSAFMGVSDYRSLLCTDGIHPNACGYALCSGMISSMA